MPLKLGSNWKSVGIGTDMRRWAHGNSRINFGFCKGDDNFGGRKRKELDDFLKSLGKQMTLTLYRMEDTERVRMKLREDRRAEVREKAEKEEEMEKLKEERLERNRRWREKKFGSEKLSIDDNPDLSEREQRKLKNKEWREKRANDRSSTNSVCNDISSKNLVPRLEHLILTELMCPYCHEEMGPPTLVYQCSNGHNLCSSCKHRPDINVCPECMSEIAGRNIAVERLALTLYSQCGFGGGVDGGLQEYVSKSFIYKASQDALDAEAGVDNYAESQDTSEGVSEIDSILLMTEGETLRIK